LTDIEETRIRCPGCGKLVPAMKYCIYCGTRLPQAAPPLVRPPVTAPPTPPTVPPPTAQPPVQAPARAVARPPLGLNEEITSLMSEIAALYERRVILIGLLQSNQVSEKVFLKIYNEYMGRLNNLLNARTNKINELRSILNEKSLRLSEVAVALEELDIRRKVGEIDINTFNQKVESLKREESELQESLKTLKTNLDTLEKILAQKKPREIRDLEVNLRLYQDALEKLHNEGKISKETYDAIKPSIEETINLLDSIIKDRKEKEKELREKLETLQTRYKLSEFSLEEYEKTKREIQAEIDKTWE
jgi:chromosome segregation ATPase